MVPSITSTGAIAAAAVRYSGHVARARAVRASSFFYDLPKERIALRPPAQRSSSRLLVAHGASPRAPDVMQHRVFDELPALLPRSCRIVMNSSRVIRARIPMTKATGGRAEVLLLSPVDRSDPTPQLAAPLRVSTAWKVFVGGRRIRVGDVLAATGPSFDLTATVMSRDGPAAVVRFGGSAPDLLSALNVLGLTPLPPYMNRDADAADASAYQTVYADRVGSVAAPTAGLHMTADVLDGLRERRVGISCVTLHVGAGTFLPIGGETAGEHDMHEERFYVGTKELREIANDAKLKRAVVAVVRTTVGSGPLPNTPVKALWVAA
jgi:S-adenosylmethionine:tRNA ribosyltransferase-isomerase